MNKPIVATALIFIFACAALAGSISQLVCDSCRFESNDLFEGSGTEGVIRTIVFCRACKNFYTLPTALIFGGQDSCIQQPQGSEEFLGKDRKVYACPRCQSPAVAYEGPVCPLCLKSSLRKTNNGMWD